MGVKKFNQSELTQKIHASMKALLGAVVELKAAFLPMTAVICDYWFQ